jgi:pentatricopeptide repeat protein
MKRLATGSREWLQRELARSRPHCSCSLACCSLSGLDSSFRIHPQGISRDAYRPFATGSALFYHRYAVVESIKNGDPQRAETLFHEMLQEYHNGNEQACPDTDALNMVLKAWLDSNHPQAAWKAESMLTRLQVLRKEGQLEDEFQPDFESFNLALACWAKNAKQPDAVDHAEALVEQMRTQGLCPDINTYASLLKILVKNGDLEKAEACYQQIEQPNDRIMGLLLKGWSKHTDAEACEVRLRQMEQATGTVNMILYSMVMHQWARQGTPHEAERLLREMIRSDREECQPDLAAFHIVLDAWSNHKSPKAPERAESILTRMWQLYESGRVATKPTVATYTKVLECWTKSKYDGAPTHAEGILRTMHHLYLDGHEEMLPTADNANAVMRAWVKRGNPERAEALLHSLFPRSVDSSSFLIVLSAWSKSRSPQSRARIEALLSKIQRSVEAGDFQVRSTSSINRIAQYFANSTHDDDEAPEHAETLLRCLETSNAAQPDVVTYNTVMNAWASVGNAFRAEKLLSELIRNYEQGGRKRVWPDTQSFTIVLKAWTKSDTKLASDRAVSILSQMKTLSIRGLASAEPNIVSYNTVLYCLDKSSSLERLETVLSEIMEESSDPGTKKSVQPDTITFVTVLNAFAKSGQVDKAEVFVKRMEEFSDARPDVRTYCALMNAWARSGRKEGPERVENLFHEMEQLYKAGDKGMRPNNHSFQIVMTALARQGEAERVEAYLRRKELRPTVWHYNAAMLAWSQCANPQAAIKAGGLLEEMRNNDLSPDAVTFSNFLQVLDKSSLLDKGLRAKSVISLMDQLNVEPDEKSWHLLKKLASMETVASL